MQNKIKKAANVSAIVIGIALFFCTAVLIIMHFYISKINFENNETMNYLVCSDQILVIDCYENKNKSIYNMDGKRLQLKNQTDVILSNMYKNNVINIMLVGCDLRKINDASRADTIILLSINKSTKKIIVTSFMRDIYLKIPGHGYNRINAAFAYGGVQLVLDTIEQNFEINVDKYAEVNFYTFIELVDALGGVTVGVNEDDINNINKSINEQNYYLKEDINEDIIKSEGTMHLNGKQTLGYVRNRGYANGDFTRTQNQREVVLQLCNKIFNLKLNEANDMLCTYLPKITTNLTEAELFSLLLCVNDYINYEIYQICIPHKDTFSYDTVNEMSVLQIDFDKNIKYVKQNIYTSEDKQQ